VVQSDMGRALADYLIEHLPFESEPRVIIDTVRLVLQPGLIEPEVRQRLWEKGAAQNVYRIGFLEAEPDSLPQPFPARADLEALRPALTSLATGNNPIATLLLRILDSPGQTVAATCEQLQLKLSSQEAVVAVLNSISRYFLAVRSSNQSTQDVAVIVEEAESRVNSWSAAQELLAELPALHPQLLAMQALAHMDEAIVTPIFAHSSASGTLMRRKIEPVIKPVLAQIAALRHASHG
jgi:hypothetical protein